MAKSKVLFLCVGNSCRSQMAEAIVNARMGDRWEAYSAGSLPTGKVHPLAIKALSEIGIEHHGRTKSVDEFRGWSFDLVVILCYSSDDQCPIWLGKGKVIEKPYLNPDSIIGSEAVKLDAFRQVRDGIAADITNLLTK